MIEAPATNSLGEGDDLLRLVRLTRTRMERRQLLIGTCGVMSGMLLWILVAGGLDMWQPLSVPMRILCFVLGFLLIFALLWRCLLRSFLRRESLTHVAQRIEATIPAMHSRLVTVLDLGQSHALNDMAAVDPYSHKLIMQTRERLASFEPASLLNPRAFVRAAMLLVAIVLCAGTLLLLFRDRLPTAIARILLPAADIAPRTGITFHAEHGNLTALQGEPVTLTAIVDQGNPVALELELRAAADGSPHRLPMQRESDGRFVFTLSALDQSYDYRIVGGQTWSPVHRLTMIQRPTIESIRVKLELPQYLGVAESISITDRAQIVAPIGSTLHLTAIAQGEVTAANLQQIAPATFSAPHEPNPLSLWIDDQLPGDSQTVGDWYWTSKPVAFGLKSIIFSASQKRIAMRSRLTPLLLSPGDSFIFHAFIDPLDPPRWLTVTLSDETRRFDLTWGDVLSTTRSSQAATTRAIHLGPLPRAQAASSNDRALPAGWTRFAVPLNTLLGETASSPIRIEGIHFEIDAGHILFDGVGKTSRSLATDSRLHDEVLRRQPMMRDEQGRWRCSLPVTSDTAIAVELLNAQGHANPPMTPLLVIAQPDMPPSVQLENPSSTLTLTAIHPVAVAAWVFDDFGLEIVGLQTSRDPESFMTEPVLIRPFGPSVTRHHFAATLPPSDPAFASTSPGELFYVRLLAQDRKGQQTVSQVIRIAIAKGVESPHVTPEQRAEELARMIEKLQAESQHEVDINDLLRRWLAATSPSDALKQSLREIDARLVTASKSARELAEFLESQARRSADDERQVLHELASLSRGLDTHKPPATSDDAATLERVRQAAAHAAQRQADLEQLLRNMKALRQIRATAQADPARTAQSLQALLSQLQSARASQDLRELAEMLQKKQQQLAAIHEQQKALAKESDSKAKQELERKQQAIDAQARQAIEQVRRMMRDPMKQDDLAPQWDADAKDAQTLRDHQARRDEELAQTRQELSDAKSQASQVSKAMKQASMRIDTEPSEASSAAQELRSLLTSATTKTLLSMAGRARSMQDSDRIPLAGDHADPANAGQARGEQESPMFRRGEVVPASVLNPMDPNLPAAFYRLPPHLRQALLQGMNEAGPKSYQKLIDAYHRQLSESSAMPPKSSD